MATRLSPYTARLATFAGSASRSDRVSRATSPQSARAAPTPWLQALNRSSADRADKGTPGESTRGWYPVAVGPASAADIHLADAPVARGLLLEVTLASGRALRHARFFQLHHRGIP